MSESKPIDPLADFIAAAKVVARRLTWAVAGGIATPEQVALVKLLLLAVALLCVALAYGITWAIQTDTDNCLNVPAPTDEVEP